MSPDPLPSAGPDDPGLEDDWDAGAHLDAVVAAADAGEYEMLPAGEMFPDGFAPGGTPDTMAPGPVLAALVHDAVGRDGAALADLPDDELLSVIRAARRMESRAVWTAMAAVREFAARRPAGSATDSRTGFREFAADELGWDLRMSWQAAAGQMAYACQVAERLPRTFAALAAGKIQPLHVRIMAEETAVLSPEDAAAGHRARPIRSPWRGRWLRTTGRRVGQGPGDRRRPASRHPLVPDRPAPRRHRRCPRLRRRPSPLATRCRPAARQQTARPAQPAGRSGHAVPPDPEHHPAPSHPRSLRPRPGRAGVPAQSQAPAPGQRPHPPLQRPRLRAPRRPLRPGSHHRLGPGRLDLSM
jgi:hypothetical protein